ncbi:MAG TPA: DUF4167 domain-containing protein [Devosiaceae bacterium]|jgi:hypothetical protein|nr:DUF4167 domain-containing protein [Devosiaceae bacterium]
MRPNQQNSKNRSRGRNNNGGRKHVNSLNRSFESNGPDVKVRGNAAHIAEKYLQLARDAQSSGDGVMAENYLQHAEHYFRIVAAAQPQTQLRTDQSGQGNEAEDDDDDFPPMNDRFASPEPVNRPAQQQPEQQQAQGNEAREENQPAETAASADNEQQQQQQQQPEGGEGRRRERRPRRRSRSGGEGEQGSGDAAGGPQPEVGELPAFLTAGGATTAAE